MNRGRMRVVAVFFTVSLLSPMLTGCWDRMEVEQRATVLAVSVDETQPGEQVHSGGSESSDTVLEGPKQAADVVTRHIIRLTAQIAVPGRIPLGAGEGSGTGSNPQQSVWLVKAYGRTFQGAIQELQQVVADPIFLGHLRVVVVSESFAKDYGMEPLLDYIRRNPEARRTMWLLICKGDAAKVLKTAPPLERVPALYLNAVMEQSSRLGKMPKDFMSVILSRQYMFGREPVFPYVTLVDDEDVRVSGLAVVQADHLKFTMAPKELAVYMELTGNKAAGYTVRVPLKDQEFINWKAFNRHRTIQVKMINGRPEIDEKIHVDGNVVERTGARIDLSDPQTLRQIDQKIEVMAHAEEMALIQKLQDNRTDIVGYGEFVRAKQNRYWRQHIHTKQDWTAVFPSIPIHVKLTIRTHRTGMRAL